MKKATSEQAATEEATSEQAAPELAAAEGEATKDEPTADEATEDEATEDEATEELLTGGNVAAAVVRVGDTVRRPAGFWTPAVHALLRHLHEVGFQGAPVPLGIDDQGREVLSYAPGVVCWPDHFDLLDPADQLVRCARLIRELHDALAGFRPPPGARWQTLIPAEGTDLIIHHDLAPWNLVLGERWVIIDWDVAGPGSRLWDLAYAAHGFVPLSANPAFTRTDAADRLRRFVDAYGLDEAQRRELVPMLTRRTRAMHDFLADQAGRGVEPWATHWRTGHGEAWRSDADYTAAREQTWAESLLR